jgi:hypothetical protein
MKAGTGITGHYLIAQILRLSLGVEKLDRDVVEGAAGVGAGDVGEAAAGVADLAVGHHDAGFGFSLDSVDDVGRTERNIKVGNIVLVKERCVVRGDAHAEYADVGIFQDEMMVRLLRDGNGGRRLSVEREREKEQ